MDKTIGYCSKTMAVPEKWFLIRGNPLYLLTFWSQGQLAALISSPNPTCPTINKDHYFCFRIIQFTI